MYCMYRGNISETCVGSDLASYLNKMVTFTVNLSYLLSQLDQTISLPPETSLFISTGSDCGNTPDLFENKDGCARCLATDVLVLRHLSVITSAKDRKAYIKN